MSRRKALEAEVARLTAEVAWLREGCDKATRERDALAVESKARGDRLIEIARAAARIAGRSFEDESPAYTVNYGTTR